MTTAAVQSGGTPAAGLFRLWPDVYLVRSASHGERRAFAAIFDRYYPELYRYCRAILGDEEEAADALQNTMVKVLQALPGEERSIVLRPWLYRIAHNEAISMLRRVEQTAELDEEAAIDHAESLESHVESRDRLRTLVSDLEAVPERQRGALVMRGLSGMKYSEIAAAFGTSSAVARQTVYEARVALREMTEGRENSCDAVREKLSENDGRALRGRKLRAHLRHCSECRTFRAGIKQRGADSSALAPPVPVLAAGGLLKSILGSGHGGGGGLAGSLGAGGTQALSTSAALKAAVIVIATTTVAGGMAVVSGTVPMPVSRSAETAFKASPRAISRPFALPTSSAPGATRKSGSPGIATSSPAGDAAGTGYLVHSAASTHPAGALHNPGDGPKFGTQVARSHRPANLPPRALNHPSPPVSPGIAQPLPSGPSVTGPGAQLRENGPPAGPPGP
jgi:RNA polymerase sigma factor (sigma-70 family)